MTTPAETPPPADFPTGDVIVHVFGRTDVGRTREHNEDAFIVVDLTADRASLQAEVRTHVTGPRGTLFMVADGLGGAAAGEIASELAVNTVYEELRTRWVHGTDNTPASFAATLKAAAEAANTRIFTYALEHPENRGLGTTATIAGLLGDTLYVAQVGDSRAYLIRDGVARQITKDQSLMQRLIEAGELTPDEAERSERRNIILQALGPEPSVKIDLTYQRLRRGDTLVLCTDGLSGLVKKDEIAEVVAQFPDLVEVCRELIERANENGGPDNITVIAARFDGNGLMDAGPDDRVEHAPFPMAGNDPTPPHGKPRLEGARPAMATPPSSTAVYRSGAGYDDTPPPPSTRGWWLAIIGILILAGLLLAAREWGVLSHRGAAVPAHDSASAQVHGSP